MAKLESFNYGTAVYLRHLLGVSDVDPSAYVFQLPGLREGQAWQDQVPQMQINEVICTRGVCVRGGRLVLEQSFPAIERSLIS